MMVPGKLTCETEHRSFEIHLAHSPPNPHPFNWYKATKFLSQAFDNGFVHALSFSCSVCISGGENAHIRALSSKVSYLERSAGGSLSALL